VFAGACRRAWLGPQDRVGARHAERMFVGPPREADPLADWAAVMSLFGLPTPLASPPPVIGGWSHSVWRVDTAAGVYAIKEMREGRGSWWIEHLNSATSFELAAWRTRAINMAEPIPVAGSRALLGRLEVGGGHRWYRCHRWVDGEPCLGDDADVARSAQVGEIVAELSRLNMQKGTTAEQIDWNALDAYHDTVAEAYARGFEWAAALAALEPQVERLRGELSELALRAMPMWMSHRDLDPKNSAVRADGALVLFDWDNAGPRLFESELLDAATSFAGSAVDADCFAATLDAYLRAGGRPLTFEHATAPIVADGFGWIMLNAWRSLGHRDATPEQEIFAGVMVKQLADAWPADADRMRAVASGITLL
jgi:hypothetical protein